MMNQVHMLASIMFGINLLRRGEEVAPIFVGVRPGDDGKRLMISPRNLTTNEPYEKEVVTSVVAAAMRAWGANEIMFLADAYVIRTHDPKEAEVPPSQNPKYVDALVINMYRADGPDEGVYVEHYLDDEGQVHFKPPFLQPPPPPESEVPALTDQNRFPRIIHRALSMTDEEVERMLKDWPEGTNQVMNIEQMFEVMNGAGYVVVEGDDDGRLSEGPA